MQPNIRVMLFDEDGERFFGEGPCRLLHAIEQTGSLRAAAQSMQMAYTKALGLVRHAEQVLGFALTERKIGGKGGGRIVGTDSAHYSHCGCGAQRDGGCRLLSAGRHLGHGHRHCCCRALPDPAGPFILRR